ncbi:hypothetical protein PR003_g18391 [Phytophthora rubi]|uniref:Uncharacterized protein n=1 Tax=Phytophthora rubi TaxID=129364 RepID=A0A6A4EH35_9STRA|nr:hypothetical protein PR001_g17194 [Phytophthora rubi]KAE9007938.1 hypothetical protein PR002_g16051 [Phytophthora rubi]KAE9317800.1 hypothetical protein PR003_g18391 [Phytophthora rubi]
MMGSLQIFHLGFVVSFMKKCHGSVYFCYDYENSGVTLCLKSLKGGILLPLTWLHTGTLLEEPSKEATCPLSSRKG